MVYMGSKNRISKYILCIIEKYRIESGFDKYVEPFVGGANIIDKVMGFSKKTGYDNNIYLISMLDEISKKCGIYNRIKNEDSILESEYIHVRDNKDNFKFSEVGFVGFCASYGGRFFAGYARDKKTGRDIPKERVRNLLKQSDNLDNIIFLHEDYINLTFEGHVIYCDPPYKGTTKYKDNKFNHDSFWDWCRKQSENNVVLISEYNAPHDFKCIWEKKINSSLTQDTGSKVATERLFILEK